MNSYPISDGERKVSFQLTPEYQEIQYCVSTNGEESSETVQPDSLEDEHVSEEGEGETQTVCVSQEIKRFQSEINKVATANIQFYSWKQNREGVRSVKGSGGGRGGPVRRTVSMDSLLDTDGSDSQTSSGDREQPPHLPPRGLLRHNSQESLGPTRPPALPPKKKLNKRVSIAEQEVTVLGDLAVANSRNTTYNRSLERQRQIQPSSHLAPASPPSDQEVEEVELQEVSREKERVVPVLPSVRQLATKFQQPKEVRPVITRKEPVVEKVPAMLKVKKSSDKYFQVHSITARSVSREFREGLKQGKAPATDTIFRLPEAKQHNGETVPVNNNTNNVRANVVYESVRPRDLYPEAEYIRTVSPEHSGIPARPAVVFLPSDRDLTHNPGMVKRRQQGSSGTSDESSKGEGERVW